MCRIRTRRPPSAVSRCRALATESGALPSAGGGPGTSLPLAAILRRSGLPRLRVGRWNAANVFGSECADQDGICWHRRKVRELVRVGGMSDVLCLQEVRGEAAEALELAVCLLGWRVEFSAIADGRSGGVAILLSPRLQEEFPRVR